MKFETLKKLEALTLELAPLAADSNVMGGEFLRTKATMELAMLDKRPRLVASQALRLAALSIVIAESVNTTPEVKP